MHSSTLIKSSSQFLKNRIKPFNSSWIFSCLFLISLVCSASIVQATHYRYGTMSWSRVNTTTNVTTITVNQAWRRSFSSWAGANPGATINTGVTLLFGDGTSTNINLLVTSVNVAEDWLYGTFTVNHTYPGPGIYTASYANCCRLSPSSGSQNNTDGDFSAQTKIILAPGILGSPISTLPAIVNLAVGNPTATFSLPTFDPNGSSYSFALSTPSEAANGLSYSQPAGLSVNAASGLVSFNTTGKTIGHLYNSAITITNSLGASTMIDFIIKMVGNSNAPQFDYSITPINSTVLSVNPGNLLSFNVKALDLDIGDIVSLTAVGLQSGMSFSPPLPASGNPITSSFSWTPTLAQLGNYVLTFTATDLIGVQTNTSVTINVNIDPIFISPSPAAASIRVIPTGQLHKDTIKATNLDPLVNTQLLASNIPASASLSNSLPTAFSSTPSTILSWTPMPSNFGSNTLSFTANDINGRTKNHSYVLIPNTNPQFNSVPIVQATVGVPYTYTIVATDADVPFGDLLDIHLHLTALPSWLSFTDNGNGTATLSGTPGAANIGSYPLSFIAEDIYHHDHADVTQSFNLVVSPSNVGSGTTTTMLWCDMYTWPINGVTYTNSGVYTATTLSTSGAVLIHTLILTLNYTSVSNVNVTSCGPYTWPINGITYSNSGVYPYLTTGSNGCAQVLALCLNIVSGFISHDTVLACDQYTWPLNGQTYTASGIYTKTTLVGTCVNTTYLHLTINYTTVSNVFVTTCGSYTWPVNGVTYTASGCYYVLTQNPNGCANVLALCLTLVSGTYSHDTVQACDQYTWALNGMTYTAAGVYSHTAIIGNCLHTYFLHLDLHYTLVNNVFVSACGSYTWPLNGVTYTASGFYPIITQLSNGCASVLVLCLTIQTATVSNQQVTVCNSYFWPVNGMTYTTSGNYTYSIATGSGCINVYQLQLTVHSSTNLGGAIVSACNAYLWNGNTYTASGNYTYTSLNNFGCINIATLQLSILQSSSNASNLTACDTYSWNGSTYTMSGQYTGTFLNSVGCDSIHTLNLTIKQSSSGTSSISSCNSYSWNGSTYTLSGTYQASFTNAAGCDSVHTLQLLINSSSSDFNQINTCDTYIWNGATYTTSGLYTYTYLNSNGCTHTSTLQLIVHYSNTGSSSISSCNSYLWNGITYTQSGVYVGSFENATGCDSVHTLTLNITTGCLVSPRAMLCGPYIHSGTDAGTMYDSLRVQGIIPLIEPYTSLNFTPIGPSTYSGAESIGPGVLAVDGNNAIVDWVHIEIRDLLFNKVATKNALIQRDGDIVSSSDGISPLFLPSLCPGNYYVAVKHRNHLGVMCSSPVYLSSNTTSIDFTNGSVWVKSGVPNQPRISIGSIKLLWAGDTRTNKNCMYNGILNDKIPILSAVGMSTPNVILNHVYRPEDVNMNGEVKYNNQNNDKNFILNQLMLSNAPWSTPNDILSQHTPN